MSKKIEEKINSKFSSMPCTPGRGGGDAVYALGLGGALVYFWQMAPGFGDKIIAVLKAIIWPALAVYHLLQFLRV